MVVETNGFLQWNMLKNYWRAVCVRVYVRGTRTSEGTTANAHLTTERNKGHFAFTSEYRELYELFKLLACQFSSG